MGEIKSTLDLVMEKTRHMKLSPEERLEQKHRELAQRILGLLQKAQDGILGADAFRAEYEELKKEQGISDDAVFIKTALDAIDLESDNSALAALLKDIGRMDVSRLSSLCDEFHNALQDARQKATEACKDELARIHCVSGSAVIPNLEKDASWQAARQRLVAQFEHSLQQEKSRLADFRSG